MQSAVCMVLEGGFGCLQLPSRVLAVAGSSC